MTRQEFEQLKEGDSIILRLSLLERIWGFFTAFDASNPIYRIVRDEGGELWTKDAQGRWAAPLCDFMAWQDWEALS